MRMIWSWKKKQMIKADVDDEHLYYYIDMGLNYFENNRAYREKVVNDVSFKQSFMDFLLKNIFID